MTKRVLGALAACAALWLGAGAPVRADPAPAAPRQVLVLLRVPPDHAGPAASYGGGYDESAGRAARRRIAGRLARSHGLTLVDDWPMPLLGLDCFIMAVPDGRSPREEATRLSRESDVALSEPVSLFRAQGREAPAPSRPTPIPCFAFSPPPGSGGSRRCTRSPPAAMSVWR